MGLDMYLTKKTYVKNWNHMGPDERHTITIKGPRAARIKPERISIIEEEVGYWRKANEIHKWFVDHCQDGVDDCRETFVLREDLVELLKTCKTVLEQPDQAANLLPPQSGFFFGSTAIDEYYWEDIRQTIAILESALSENGGNFYYRSSW